MQPGKKNDLPPAVTAALALVGVGVLVAAAATALRDMRQEARTADAGTALDAAIAATEPPVRGCAVFAERNSNNGARDRDGFVTSLNLERRPPALGRWAIAEPRTLVIQGIAACDRAAIVAFLPQSMPSAVRAACTSFGFRLLRCEPSAGAPRTIDLTEACPCSDENEPSSCRCDF